ncbi:MAG: nucleoside-diphosphate kinase [Patescibacteria group bacterium]|nr:nucleoside-diphosphate kinase [Patescibacteria group bacterium]MDE1945843.1 nucleoside-diphosphate kinase [Patescibacteria group bacterium]
MKTEQTFVIVKPDGVQRSLVGEIIGRFEKVGLKLVAMKMLVPTREQAEKHYTLDPEWLRKVGEKTIAGYEKKGLKAPSNDPLNIGKRVLGNLVEYFTSGPVVAFVLEGAHAVALVRKLVGSTEPLTSDVGTIRGDLVLDSYQLADTDGRAVRNVIHASGSVDEAKNEINLWFKQNEVLKYRHIQEMVIYETDLGHILG